MRLIDNLTTTENHKLLFSSLVNSSTKIMIASPFLAQEFNILLNSLGCRKVKEIVLLTTLKENDIDQIYKMKSIIALKNFAKEKKIKIDIKINNRLHGKVYLFVKDKSPFRGIITSANMTENGFVKNFEWGVEIDDKSKLNEIERNVFLTSMNVTLSENAIDELIKAYHSYLSKNKDKEKVKPEKIDLNLMKNIGIQDRPFIVKDTTYWLKPIGVTDDPVKVGEKFIDEIARLEFSKTRPSGIHKDDIIIAYGVGTRKILSIYRVLSSKPEFISKKELKIEPWRKRWPWSVNGENLTKEYGALWWKKDLYITSLADKFVTNNNEPITARGGKTLGALNFGKDKIRLSPNFGNYLVNLVFNLVSNLT
ncbi:MAG: NgoFVII family restriction endonuclease [Kiritimatiellae bacterium]|jgi:HKD family nuclease|nr:NgoFVII family restriction endonuclease [Kiritimatiellia bacterium]